jgi:hypothetical protein
MTGLDGKFSRPDQRRWRGYPCPQSRYLIQKLNQPVFCQENIIRTGVVKKVIFARTIRYPEKEDAQTYYQSMISKIINA